MSQDPNLPPPYGPPPGYPNPGPGGPPPGWGQPGHPQPGGYGPQQQPYGPGSYPPMGGVPYGQPYGPGGQPPPNYGPPMSPADPYRGSAERPSLGVLGVLVALGNLAFGLCCGCGDLFTLQVGFALGSPEGKAEVQKQLEDQRTIQRQNQNPKEQESVDEVFDGIAKFVNDVDTAAAKKVTLFAGLVGLGRLLLLLSGALLFARVRASRMLGIVGGLTCLVGLFLLARHIIPMLPERHSTQAMSAIWGSAIFSGAWPALVVLILGLSGSIKAAVGSR